MAAGTSLGHPFGIRRTSPRGELEIDLPSGEYLTLLPLLHNNTGVAIEGNIGHKLQNLRSNGGKAAEVTYQSGT